MNTLPQDLIRLITKHIRASDCFLLSIETPDNQPYLNLTTIKARLKLALKENNSGWIHQILRYMKDNLYTSSIAPLLVKHGLDIGLKFACGVRDYNYYYNLGKNGDDTKIDIEKLRLDDAYMYTAFINGLSVGQHCGLFGRYATEFKHVYDYVMNLRMKIISYQQSIDF